MRIFKTKEYRIASVSGKLLTAAEDGAVPVGEDLIETLYRCFEDEKVGAAYARQLPAPDCHLIERYTRSFNYPPESCVKSAEGLP